MFERLARTEPVRLYAVAIAAAALGAYFLPSGAWPLAVGLVAAVLGIGEKVRDRVYSPDTHELELDHALRLQEAAHHVNGNLLPDDDGQTNMTLLLVFVIGFVLGALCYANGLVG